MTEAEHQISEVGYRLNGEKIAEGHKKKYKDNLVQCQRYWEHN